MAKRLILWDIDGTLVSCGSVGRRAIDAGARVVLGERELPRVQMSGKTDPQIVAEILTAAGASKEEVDALLPTALAEAERSLRELSPELAREGRILPGVEAVLVELSGQHDVRQSLVTGNLVKNAEMKLSAFGLDRYLDFDIGAYGSDNIDRSSLVPVVLQRAEALRGETYRGKEEVWVVGDTANDLKCARASGVRCLLVGTGIGGLDSVAELGADCVLPDLSDIAQVLQELLES